jgi:hypothetical protein
MVIRVPELTGVQRWLLPNQDEEKDLPPLSNSSSLEKSARQNSRESVQDQQAVVDPVA